MNFLSKLDQLDTKLNHPLVHDQVLEVKRIVKVVSRQQVLPTAPKRLGFLPDQLEELLLQLGQDKQVQLKAMNNLLNSLRQYLSLTYGIWSLPNLDTTQLIKTELHVNSALEIMAGNGYWSKALNTIGIKTVATDSLEWAKTSETGKTSFYSVENLAAAEAIAKYSQVDLIICAWAPNFDESDIEAVSSWRNTSQAKHLLFVGEKKGATNSQQFWQYEHFIQSQALRKINRSLISYDFIDEQVYEIKHEL